MTDPPEGDDMQGKKRPFQGGPAKASKKLKAQAAPKNALMHLYELKPGKAYQCLTPCYFTAKSVSVVTSVKHPSVYNSCFMIPDVNCL